METSGHSSDCKFKAFQIKMWSWGCKRPIFHCALTPPPHGLAFAVNIRDHILCLHSVGARSRTEPEPLRIQNRKLDSAKELLSHHARQKFRKRWVTTCRESSRYSVWTFADLLPWWSRVRVEQSKPTNPQKLNRIRLALLCIKQSRLEKFKILTQYSLCIQ